MTNSSFTVLSKVNPILLVPTSFIDARGETLRILVCLSDPLSPLISRANEQIGGLES